MRNQIAKSGQAGDLVDREAGQFRLPAGHTGLHMNLGEQKLLEGNPGEAYINSLAPASQKTMKSYLNWSARHLIQRHNDLEAESGKTNPTYYDVIDFVGKEGNPLNLYAVFSWNQLNSSLVNWLYDLRKKTYVTVPRTKGREFKLPSNSMLRSLLASLRGVAKEAVIRDWISQEDELLISRIKGPAISQDKKSDRYILSDDEIRTLIKITAEDRSSHGVRDAAILCLLLGMGLRREEVGAIQHDGITFARGQRNEQTNNQLIITFMGKGNKFAKLPAPQWSIPFFKGWFDWRDLDIQGPIFNPINRHEEINRDYGLTGEGIAWILEKRLRVACINEIVRPHDLRRTFAMRKLESGMDLISIKKLMRHANITTTQRYLEHMKEDNLFDEATKDSLVI